MQNMNGHRVTVVLCSITITWIEGDDGLKPARPYESGVSEFH